MKTLLIGKSTLLERRAVVRFAIFGYLPLLMALAMRVASGPTAVASYIVLAAFAMFGRSHAILSLTFSWLFSMLNTDLVPENSGGAAARYLVILAAAASALYHRGAVAKYRANGAFNMTVMLLLFLLVHSVVFSAKPDVSIMKALSWGITMLSLMALWQGLPAEDQANTANRIYHVLVGVLLGSLPLFATGPGYATNGTGFQGVLNQPQIFGMTMALLATWAGSRMLAEQRPGWFIILTTGASIAAVVLSEARTGGAALVLGIGLSLLMSPAIAGRSLIKMAPGLKSWRVWAVIFFGIATIVLMGPAFIQFLDQFISKSGRADVDGFWEAYDNSRGGLMAPMIANIMENPLRGVGFGIASDPSEMVVERDPIFGLPLGGAIEKGTALLAIFEELGIMGGLIVAWWIWRLLRNGASSGFIPFAVCMTALLLNMGEYTLFSVGGHGLLAMILFGWVYAAQDQRAEAKQLMGPKAAQPSLARTQSSFQKF